MLKQTILILFVFTSTLYSQQDPIIGEWYKIGPNRTYKFKCPEIDWTKSTKEITDDIIAIRDDPNYKSDCYWESRPFYTPNEPIAYSTRYKFKKDSVSFWGLENQVIGNDFELLQNGTKDNDRFSLGTITWGYKKVSYNHYETIEKGLVFKIIGDTLKTYDKEGLSDILFKVN